MPSTRLLPASTITSRRTPETQVKAQLIWLRYHSKVIQCCKKPMEGSGQQLNSTQMANLLSVGISDESQSICPNSKRS